MHDKCLMMQRKIHRSVCESGTHTHLQGNVLSPTVHMWVSVVNRHSTQAMSLARVISCVTKESSQSYSDSLVMSTLCLIDFMSDAFHSRGELTTIC